MHPLNGGKRRSEDRKWTSSKSSTVSLTSGILFLLEILGSKRYFRIAFSVLCRAAKMVAINIQRIVIALAMVAVLSILFVLASKSGS